MQARVLKFLFTLTLKVDKEHAGFYCHPVEIHLSFSAAEHHCSQEHFKTGKGHKSCSHSLASPLLLK